TENRTLEMARQQGPAARRRGGVLWPLRSCLAAGRSRRAASPSPVLPHTPTATPRELIWLPVSMQLKFEACLQRIHENY
uniref:Uncharacterized protein n=1 Tax=Aegilops tauschii subsp. strangulata TaxID=200361 RepID=A0A453GUK1_AEGTS